jgi:hypothetical protein
MPLLWTSTLPKAKAWVRSDACTGPAPNAEIHFERIAVNPDQISAWNLPSRPTKTTNPRAKKFGADRVELDAIEPERLRQLVKEAIEKHISAHQLSVLKAAEQNEQAYFQNWIAQVKAKNQRPSEL